MSAGQVEPCGSGSAPSRPVMSSCRHIAALVANPPCFVAEAVTKRCASSAHRYAWFARMELIATPSEKAGLEPVPYAQSGVEVGSKGVTLASFGALVISLVWGTGVCRAMEDTYAASSSDSHPSDTILDRVAEDRVTKFRRHFMLQPDPDFAAAFTSWDEAMKAGGSAVADAWMEAAAVADDTQLLRVVDDARAAARSSRQEERPPLVRYTKPKQFYKAKQRGAKKAPLAEDDLARSLAETFAMVHAYRPRNCTSQQLTDWRHVCAVAGFASTSLVCEARWSGVASGRSHRARESAPLSPWGQESSGSSPVSLEEKIIAAHGAGDPLWMPLLGAWLADFGCIRFGHFERFVVERMSQSTVHCLGGPFFFLLRLVVVDCLEGSLLAAP